jgi:hypothetical protein
MYICNDLKCRLTKVTFPANDTITFYLRDGDCVDMTGAVSLATKIMDSVREIRTYSGKQKDTDYFLTPKGWVPYETKTKG